MSTDMEVLKDAGVNVDDIIERFGGNSAIALKFMKKFSEDKSFSMLKEALEHGSADDAAMYAHTVKGVAGNLGMKEIYEAAINLEAAIKNNEENAKNEFFKKLSADYDRVIRAISTL